MALYWELVFPSIFLVLFVIFEIIAALTHTKGEL